MFGSAADIAGTLVRMVHLAHGVQAAYPREIPDVVATSAALQAIEHETPDHPAEQLLSIAGRETRLQNIDGAQCGVMQVKIGHRPCPDNMEIGFKLGVAKLEEWDELCDRMGVRHHDRCVHAGYAKGTKQARAQPVRFDRDVSRRAELIKRGGKKR